jgi:hypothetical protein
VLGAVEAEARYIAQHMKNGDWKEPPNVYVLLTNAPLSPQLRKELAKRLHDVLSSTEIHCLGAQDICAALDDAPHLRAAFPQLLGLSDLQSVLGSVVNKAVLERSTLSLEEATDLAQVFVQTRPFNQALACLAKHHFLVLTGPPEMGKTAIASMIGLSKYGEGWQSFECLYPDDVFNVYDQNTAQVFVADDAFGSTEYRPDKAQKWADDLPRLHRISDHQHWVIFTSRTGPLNEALSKMHLGGKLDKFPHPKEVVVNAAELSEHEKARILYWHAKRASLPDLEKHIIKHHYKTVISNRHFTPLRVQRLIAERLPEVTRSIVATHGTSGTPEHIKSEAVKLAVQRELEDPTKSMQCSFDNLPVNQQSFLISLLDVRGSLKLKEVHASFERHNLGDAIAPVDAAHALDGHFIRESKGEYSWIHPTWRDLVIEVLVQNSRARQAFLSNAFSPGVLLALSVSGGARGVRTKPLLLCDQDWQCLSSRIIELIRAGDSYIFSDIFNALLVQAQTQSKSGQCISSQLALSIRHTLAEFLNLWNRHDSTHIHLHTGHIEHYYALSEYISPLPPGPDLCPTWRFLCANSISKLEAWDASHDALWAIEEWLKLVSLASTNEPRFLRQVRWPQDYVPLITSFISIDHVQVTHDREFEFPEEVKDEMHRIGRLIGVMESVSSLLPELESEVNAIIEELGNRLAEIEEELHSFFPEADCDDDDYGATVKDEEYDMDSLFDSL